MKPRISTGMFSLLLISILALLFSSSCLFAAQKIDSVVFKFKPSVQTWKVPKGVTQIHVVASGAQGGGGVLGGKGGKVESDLTVIPDSLLYIFIGSQPDSNEAGFNGGGKGCGNGFGGGGASDIRIGGEELEARVLVAGGGGGGIDNWGGTGSGGGGGLVGGNGLSVFGEDHISKGGTQDSGGVAARAYLSAPGKLGVGGDALSNLGECSNGAMNGGGGGYYGGGSSAAGKGAGGSSYTNTANQNVVHEQGVVYGHGSIVISWKK